MYIAEAGHAVTHLVQPIHLSVSTSAVIPLYIIIALTGHALTQAPQATQSSFKTFAFFAFLICAAIRSHPISVALLFISPIMSGVCDLITRRGRSYLSERPLKNQKMDDAASDAVRWSWSRGGETSIMSIYFIWELLPAR